MNAISSLNTELQIIEVCSSHTSTHARNMRAIGMSTVPVVVFLCLLLQGCDGGEDDKCPPWHFTPANATTPCSECSFPETDDFYCSDTGLIIDTSLIVTATESSYPLVIGKGIFGHYKPEHLLYNSIMFTKLPSNMSELENFFCSAFKCQRFLCGQCKPGCGIAIYTSLIPRPLKKGRRPGTHCAHAQ